MIEECGDHPWGEDLQLSGKQIAFVWAWFASRFDLGRAARAAGYSAGDRPDKESEVLRAQGYQTKNKPAVREAIRREWQARGADVLAEEVIYTLVCQLRASLGQFVTGAGQVDIGAIKDAGDRIVTAYTFNARTGHQRITIESPLKAAELLGRALGLWDPGDSDQLGAEALAAVIRRLVGVAASTVSGEPAAGPGGGPGAGAAE